MIKKRIRKQLAGIIQHASWLNALYTKWKWRERRVSYGNENPEKVFFVVRRANCKAGLFSFVMSNMGLVKYGLDRGYVPVIDMQSEKNTYLDEDQVGKQNAWEFFFEQPCNYTLKDIEKSKNIILSCGLIEKGIRFPGDRITRDEKEYQEWRRLFDQYFFIKKEIAEEADALQRELFGKERVLGVLCRGTDYVNTRPKDHPVQPSVDQVIKKIYEVMEKQRCTRIYLTTEDADIFARFRNEFGASLLSMNTKRYSDTGKDNINDIALQKGENKYFRGRQYLLSVLLLSQCDCLVAGSAGGTYGALLMGKEYDYKYIFNLGTY